MLLHHDIIWQKVTTTLHVFRQWNFCFYQYSDLGRLLQSSGFSFIHLNIIQITYYLQAFSLFLVWNLRELELMESDMPPGKCVTVKNNKIILLD